MWLIQSYLDKFQILIDTQVSDHPFAEGSCRSLLGSPNHVLTCIALTHELPQTCKPNSELSNSVNARGREGPHRMDPKGKVQREVQLLTP
ncbi:hypothetical protein SADUNF_Sadunf04G0038200 [Salix dunnii]|uniref:Uncharacterized protein n=1 Tax=Salix dunnii TaxID=1413687 RepID=A0A835K7Z7_9ROSI|nr:hypothetical protein SADUNF_Sadunf04G0038200 [Salix dunnii]